MAVAARRDPGPVPPLPLCAPVVSWTDPLATRISCGFISTHMCHVAFSSRLATCDSGRACACARDWPGCRCSTLPLPRWHYGSCAKKNLIPTLTLGWPLSPWRPGSCVACLPRLRLQPKPAETNWRGPWCCKAAGPCHLRLVLAQGLRVSRPGPLPPPAPLASTPRNTFPADISNRWPSWLCHLPEYTCGPHPRSRYRRVDPRGKLMLHAALSSLACPSLSHSLSLSSAARFGRPAETPSPLITTKDVVFTHLLHLSAYTPCICPEPLSAPRLQPSHSDSSPNKTRRHLHHDFFATLFPSCRPLSPLHVTVSVGSGPYPPRQLFSP